MLAHSLKTYFPSAPRPAGDIAPPDFAQYVKKYPKIAAHVARMYAAAGGVPPVSLEGQA